MRPRWEIGLVGDSALREHGRFVAALRRRLFWFDLGRGRRREWLVIRPGSRGKAGGQSAVTAQWDPNWKGSPPVGYGDYRVAVPAKLVVILKQPEAVKYWTVQVRRRVLDITEVVDDPNGEPGVVVLRADLTSHRAKAGNEPVLRPDTPDLARFGALTAVDLYDQVVGAWKQLTEVRFKLLAFLPVASGIGLYQVLGADTALSSLPRGAQVGACVFGFVVTAAVAAYERRNSELYDDLISVGRRLEADSGIARGVFAGRLPGTFPVRHDVALGLVYGAALLAWLGAGVFTAVHTEPAPSPPVACIQAADGSLELVPC